MIRVLLTGVTGLVGSALAAALAESGHAVRAALRTDRPPPPGCAESVLVGDIGPDTDWTIALRDVDQVVHAAARVHVRGDESMNAELYMQTNAHGTQRLAAAAADAGVSRFVLLSTVKVNGEETTGHAYTPSDEPRPRDGYAMSKWVAEQLLTQLAARSAMQAVIVRAPLVYGPGVRANFLRLLRWVDRERLLPLAAIRNQRSLVSVWNLCDLLLHVLEHPAAAGRTWMVSDGRDVSTPDLVRYLASAMGRRARLLHVPVPLLLLAGGLLGNGAEMRRLCGSLTVDIAQTRERLSWSPPLSMDEALARTVSWYQSQGRSPP
jgi:nucleoside-diphosphate-sugar epimerase